MAGAGDFASLAEILDCFTAHCDHAGTILSLGRNCEAVLGLPQRELMGRGLFERVQVADRPAFLKTVSDALSSGRAVSTKLRLRVDCSSSSAINSVTNPVFVWLEMRAICRAPFPARQRGSKQVLIAFRGLHSDRLAPEAPGAPDKKEKVSKEIMLAHAGHELRAPLTAIAGFSELLADPQHAPDPEKQREYAKIIHQSGLHLLDVVEAVLDLSVIQSGSLAVEPERFAVAAQIDLCCDMVRLQALSRQVELLRAYPPNLDEITGDKRVFTQILVNLLSNALKFTPPGGRVTVSAKAEAGQLMVTVSDTGIGIAAADLARLGNPFFQVKTFARDGQEGTGLGLSIVRALTGLAGGAIRIASEPGKGTRVCVGLPINGQDLMARPGALAKIETVPLSSLSGSPPGETLFDEQMMVKKIA
ncbi:MAG TPA: PAS domain-containing sensor histidine kinase [Methylocella sp.]|nr:PAS domain-containing sensor histidine kinase [Methylocella sp.]